MRRSSLTFALIFLFLPHVLWAAGDPGAIAYEKQANLVQNGSFEMDWMHNKVSANTRFMLLEQSDWGYAQADGIPDCWLIRSGAGYQDDAAGKFGSHALRLTGEASQVIYLCGVTDPPDGGSNYNAFKPLSADLQKKITDTPLHFGAWCKTTDAASEPVLSVTVEYADGDKITPKSSTASFDKGSHDWQYRSIDFPTLPSAGIAHAATIRLTGSAGGSVWFDGISCVQDDSPAPNLLPNGNFTDRKDGYPAHWSAPQLWSWSRRDYYRFTGWSHENGRMRGGAFATDGVEALQLIAYPGDNLAVKSDPITLNQPDARPLRVSARIAADNLRWFEIMAQDEAGQWIPQLDFSGFMGTDENYRNRLLAAGTHESEYVSKYFAPAKPVKQLTLFICVRGIDGRSMQKNVVGSALVQDVRLVEMGLNEEAAKGRSVAIQPTAEFNPEAARTHNVGERLWGDNILATIGGAANPAIAITSPDGKPIALEKGASPADSHFRVDLMCTDWERQYRISAPGLPPMAFGTPASAITVRTTSSYVYPDEKAEAAINLNVTKQSLAKDVRAIRVVLRSPNGERVLLDSPEPSKAFWSVATSPPATLEEGFADARNLIAVPIESKGVPIHQANEPVRDCSIVVTLKDKAGKVIAEQSSSPFGFMQRPIPTPLPDKIESTSLSPNGQMLVNGRPFFFRPFPIDKADLGSMSRMQNFPKTHKILPLPFPKELIFKPEEEASWKEKVQDFVRKSKDDPRLFGYFFNHDGETSFWFDQWEQMAECQRKVAAWVREVDPNHLILSAEWLFGHGALKPESGKTFDYLDEIDVEPGLRWTPLSDEVRKAAGRPIAIVAGLETYYSQSPQLIRWRTYEALRLGASDAGICPSGMLGPKPETITFLRGLYGELSGLEPMFVGAAPQEAATCDNPSIHLWQRQSGPTRYIVATRDIANDQPDPALAKVELKLPKPSAKPLHVMFEGRELMMDGQTFTDDFTQPYTVHVYRIE